MQHHLEIHSSLHLQFLWTTVNTYILASKCSPNHWFSAHGTHYVSVQTHVTVKVEDPGPGQASIFLAEYHVYVTYSPPFLQHKYVKINYHSMVSSQNNCKPAPSPHLCHPFFYPCFKVILRIIARLFHTQSKSGLRKIKFNQLIRTIC